MGRPSKVVVLEGVWRMFVSESMCSRIVSLNAIERNATMIENANRNALMRNGS